MSDTDTDILRRLENLIKLGTILAVQYNPPRVRVKSGGVETALLPWLTIRAGTTRDWDPPTIGEQCLLLCPSGELTTGVVLVGINSSACPAPSSDPDLCSRVYPDGAQITYNHANGMLLAAGVQTAVIQAAKHCTINCPDTTVTGNVQIDGNLTVSGLLTYQAGLSGTSGGAGTVISGSITQTGGNLVISGSLTQTGGNLTSNGVVLHTHVHPNPEGGDVGKPK